MASCVRNICTKNYQNLIIGFQVTVKNVRDVFFGTQRIITERLCQCQSRPDNNNEHHLLQYSMSNWPFFLFFLFSDTLNGWSQSPFDITLASRWITCKVQQSAPHHRSAVITNGSTVWFTFKNYLLFMPKFILPIIRSVECMTNKKFELMLTKCAKAYSSSCSQAVNLSPAISSRLLQKYRFFMPSCADFLESKKSRLRPSKSTFNAENFTCSLFMSIIIGFNAICSWNVSRSQESPKNP